MYSDTILLRKMLKVMNNIEREVEVISRKIDKLLKTE